MSDMERRRTLHGVVDVPDANVLGPGQTRASDPLRSRYIERLAEAYAYGVISREEHDARVGAAQNAVTEFQLRELESDLPDLKRHLGQIRGKSFFDRTKHWLETPIHRHVTQIALFPFFALWIALGITLPIAFVKGPGMQGCLVACFAITGFAGFIINLISYAIWSNE